MAKFPVDAPKWRVIKALEIMKKHSHENGR